MKKKNFFRNCNAGRMLLVIVCLAALFASPQRAWADDDKVSVTIDGNTTKYGIVDEAMIAVNAATSNVTVKLLTDVELLVNPDPEHLQYGNIRFANTNTVTEESGTRPVTSHGGTWVWCMFPKEHVNRIFDAGLMIYSQVTALLHIIIECTLNTI